PESPMLKKVIPQRRVSLGAFEVGRVLPYVQQRMVGPFIFWDHIGPAEVAAGVPASADVRPHPHIGLATVSYLFEGAMTHRDSVGSEQVIRPGDVNWMVAGSGITHSERFEDLRRRGGRLHGIQAWVALPVEQEEIAPSFHHHPAASLPRYTSGGLQASLIAGRAFGAESPVAVASPMFYVHWQLAAGALAELPAEYPERAAYIAEGEVEVLGARYGAGQMLVFDAGAPIRFRAERPSTVLLLGGEPVGPRYIDWNFVSSRRERILQARADYQAGRMKLPDLDGGEFIPLPPAP
ncbi:MAG TPA: pirin family protein, partial [Nevskiaceae bacterium]|nr:pirin family protein [Nevskiaceae bacterium]